MTQLELIDSGEPATPAEGFDLIAQIFMYEGHEVRTVIIDGSPWFVGRDVCAPLKIAKPESSLARLDDDEKGSHTVGTPGGMQELIVISEPGLYSLVLRSRRPEAKAFKRWITHVVLPALRRDGRYEIQAAPAALTEIEAARRYLAALEREEVERSRADVAESRVAELEPAAENWEQIQGGDGINLKSFRKKYFSAVAERAFFEHLYARDYLIDQRGKGGWSERRQKYRDGWQHRHPSAKGSDFLFLHTDNDRQGERRENARVLSGEPELALREALIRDGLTPNIQSARLEIES